MSGSCARVLSARRGAAAGDQRLHHLQARHWGAGGGGGGSGAGASGAGAGGRGGVHQLYWRRVHIFSVLYMWMDR
tara:strand:+ start:3746 stop:3970 length:225 start_codon:yes stop_codon:yes gene_type:complete